MALPLEAAAVITELALPGGLSLERRGPGTRNAAGEVVPATPTVVLIAEGRVAVVPVTGRRLQRDTTDRPRETIDVYSMDVIYAGTATQAADVVLYSGRRFTVIGVQDYNAAGLVWIATAELQEALA